MIDHALVKVAPTASYNLDSEPASMWAIMAGPVLGRVTSFDPDAKTNQVQFSQGPATFLIDVPTVAVEVIEVIE